VPDEVKRVRQEELLELQRAISQDRLGRYVGRETEIAIGGNIGSSHPNAAGYELIAQGLARELIARELLPQRVVTAGGTAPPAAPRP
ncbi:MAG: hypothetical protein ABFS41_06990, partial [Myxococcota bacterium]